MRTCVCVFFAQRSRSGGRPLTALFFTHTHDVQCAVNIARGLRDYFGVHAWVESYFEPAHRLTAFEQELERRRAEDIQEFFAPNSEEAVS